MADAPSYGVSQADIADPTALVGPELGMLAAQVTQGAETPYDQAIALQLWFTAAGGFRYSTNIDGGSDVNALDTFLRERVGYCEQFAATMALMARSLGIPARVVVGFTSGRQEEGAWVIRGTDAHAWPELWMGAAGWIRFEPTPGAPTVRAPAYTREANSSVIPGVPTAAASPGATADGLGADGRLPESSNDAVSADALNAGSLWRRLAALVCVLLLLAIPALIRTVRRRRRAVGGPEQAFREVVDTARDHRLLRGELPTARATIAAIAGAVRVPDELLAAAIRASSAGTAVDVRAVIARATPRSLPGLERTSESDERPIELAAALGRICGAVERGRYAMPQEAVLVTATVGTGADEGAHAVPPTAGRSGPATASRAIRGNASGQPRRRCAGGVLGCARAGPAVVARAVASGAAVAAARSHRFRRLSGPAAAHGTPPSSRPGLLRRPAYHADPPARNAHTAGISTPRSLSSAAELGCAAIDHGSGRMQQSCA